MSEDKGPSRMGSSAIGSNSNSTLFRQLFALGALGALFAWGAPGAFVAAVQSRRTRPFAGFTTGAGTQQICDDTADTRIRMGGSGGGLRTQPIHAITGTKSTKSIRIRGDEARMIYIDSRNRRWFARIGTPRSKSHPHPLGNTAIARLSNPGLQAGVFT